MNFKVNAKGKRELDIKTTTYWNLIVELEHHPISPPLVSDPV